LDSLATVKTDRFGAIAVRHRDWPRCGRNNDGVPSSGYSHGTLAMKECPACRFVDIDSAPHYQVQAETMAWERTNQG
jgi:hypothetical protein